VVTLQSVTEVRISLISSTGAMLGNYLLSDQNGYSLMIEKLAPGVYYLSAPFSRASALKLVVLE
jgi:hypothetical protein